MDPAVLQNALGLGEVLEGAVDAGREVGHVPGLQHELGGGAGDRVSTPGGPPSRPGPRPPWAPPRPQAPPTQVPPRPTEGGCTHRNLRCSHGHVARLHAELHALQQVRGEALGLRGPLAGILAGAAAGVGVGWAQAGGQRGPRIPHPLSRPRGAGPLTLSSSRDAHRPQLDPGEPALGRRLQTLLELPGADSHAVQDTPAAVGVSGPQAQLTRCVLHAALHRHPCHLAEDP